MKFFAPVLLVFAFQSRLFAAPTDWTLTPVSSRQKLTALTRGFLQPFKPEPIQIHAVRGEWQNFQFVVSAGAQRIEKLEIKPNGLASISADFIPATNLQLFRENYVEVKHPSGNKDLTPKWWPDALIPLNLASASVEANQSAVFWGSLKIPEDAHTGEYYGEIDFLADGAPRRLAVSVTVDDAALPTPRFRGTVAVYYDALRDWYKKDGQIFTDEEWAVQKKRFYDFLLDYRINAYDLPVAWDSLDVEKYLTDPRVLSVRMPPLDSPDFAVALEKFKSTQTLSKAFYYWIDEPQTPAAFASVRAATEKLRKLGIKHLVTAHPNAALKDAVDIWCPNIGDFFGVGHLDLKALAQERQKGRETWLYTMVEPRFPAPTWLLDDDASSVLAYSSIWASGGFTGFVYSMAHGWGPKPLEDLTSFEGTNGDGTLLYPAEVVGGKGPMPSIRLMLLRDAIENYELKRDLGSSVLIETPNLIVRPTTGRAALGGSWEKTSGYPQTAVTWKRLNGFLMVNFEASNPSAKDYVAVELAPRDGGERWRFVLTTKGIKVVERHTREGAFQLPEFPFEGMTRLETGGAARKYFLKIPLRQIPWAKNGVRFDALYRAQTRDGGTRFTQRLTDAGADPFALPLLAVDKAVTK